MADTYTTGLKNFIINNINGGYITSTTTISTSDLNARINEIIGTTYTKIADLHNVAFSGDYTKLKNTPQLADVALTGDYGDLKNTPQLSNVALSGSYYDLPDRPDLSATIQSELGDTVDEAILNVKNQILGQNVTSNYNTLEKLQNRKAEVVYMDVTSNEYGSLNNFGSTSFSENGKHILISKIETEYLLNKIIILENNNTYFIVNNFQYDNNNIYISIFRIIQNNYTDLKTQYEIDNEELDYITYINNHIHYNFVNEQIIYDSTKNISLFIHSTFENPNDNRSLISEIFTALTNNGQVFNNFDTRISACEAMFNNLTELADRVTLLESYHSSTEPEPEEQTEP